VWQVVARVQRPNPKNAFFLRVRWDGVSVPYVFSSNGVTNNAYMRGRAVVSSAYRGIPRCCALVAAYAVRPPYKRAPRARRHGVTRTKGTGRQCHSLGINATKKVRRLRRKQDPESGGDPAESGRCSNCAPRNGRKVVNVHVGEGDRATTLRAKR